jgi:hypothetical protein
MTTEQEQATKPKKGEGFANLLVFLVFFLVSTLIIIILS